MLESFAKEFALEPTALSWVWQGDLTTTLSLQQIQSVLTAKNSAQTIPLRQIQALQTNPNFPSEGFGVIIAGNLGTEITGTTGRDGLDGRGGNDLLRSGARNDLVNGGTGDDVVIAGRNDDVVVGGPGNDLLFGDRGADWLTGGLGNDLFVLDFQSPPYDRGYEDTDLYFEVRTTGGKSLDLADTIEDFVVGEDGLVFANPPASSSQLGEQDRATVVKFWDPLYPELKLSQPSTNLSGVDLPGVAFLNYDQLLLITGGDLNNISSEAGKNADYSWLKQGGFVVYDILQKEFLAKVRTLQPTALDLLPPVPVNTPPFVENAPAALVGKVGDVLAVDLHRTFGDQQDPDTALRFSVLNRSPQFEVVSQTGDRLSLRLTQPGVGAVILQAQDTGGLTAQTTLSTQTITITEPAPFSNGGEDDEDYDYGG